MRNRHFVLLAFVILVHTQDLVLSLLFPYLGVSTSRLLVAGKFVVAIALILVFMSDRKSKSPVRVPIIPLFVVAISSIHLAFDRTSISLSNKLGSFVSIVTPFVLYYVGVASKLSARECLAFTKGVVYLALISVLFGVFDLLFLSVDTLWANKLHLGNYLVQVKEIPTYSFDPNYRLPYNFFYNYFSEASYRRLVGLSAAVLATSYFLIFPIQYLFFRERNLGKNTTNFFITIILFAGILLTLTRGAIISLLIGSFVAAYVGKPRDTSEYNKVSQKNPKTAGKLLLLLTGITVFFGTTVTPAIPQLLSGTDGSSAGHIRGTLAGFRGLVSTLVIGNGLGVSGGAGYRGAVDLNQVGENAYLVIADQIGLIGAILSLTWLLSVIRDAFLLCKEDRMNGRVALASSFSLFVSGFASEQILTFTTFPAVWIFLGTTVGNRKVVNRYVKER